MRLLRPELIFCAICCVACARPTLDEEGDDSGAPTIADDAGGQPSAQSDAHVDAPQVDAGTDVNPAPPRDAGGSPLVDTGVAANDGGDMLPPVLANCDATGIMSSVPVGQAVVKGVTINGAAGTMASVKTGASVAITVSVNFETCNSVFSAPALFLGINDGSTAECKYTTGCSEVSPVPIPAVDLQFTVSAPKTPGTYYVMAGLKATICTGGTGSASIADTPVAALCVTQ